MNTTKQAPTNGATKSQAENTKPADKTQTSNGENSKDVKPQQPVNTTAVIPINKTEKKEIPIDEQKPIEDRVLKIQVLIDLVERRDKLLETQRKLNSFRLSSDGSKDKLSINDGKGNEFLTTNSAVIKDVIETLKISLQEKLSEVEKHIVF